MVTVAFKMLNHSKSEVTSLYQPSSDTLKQNDSDYISGAVETTEIRDRISRFAS